MKHLFFCTILFFTTSLSAQEFEFGVNGGIGYNTAPSVSNATALSTQGEKPSSVSPMVSVRALYARKKWKYGVEAGGMNISYKLAKLASYYVIDGRIVENFNGQETAVLAKPAVPVKFIIERAVTFKKMEVYANATAGYIFATNSSIPSYYSVATSAYSNINTSGHGISAGLQLGGTYFISKRIGINAEVACDYMYLNISVANYKLFASNATLGVRYRL